MHTGLNNMHTAYLTPKQVMETLHLSENVIYRELQYGFLRGVARRCGRQWRIDAAGLHELMRAGQA